MGQPVRSKEDLLTDPLKSSTEIAPGGSHPHRSPCRNLPMDPVEDELARDPGPVRGPHSGSTSPAPSRNPTPGPEPVPARIPAPVPAPVPAPAPPSSNEIVQTIHEGLLGVKPRT